MIQRFLNDLDGRFPSLHLARNGLLILQGFIDRKEMLHLVENVGRQILDILILIIGRIGKGDRDDLFIPPSVVQHIDVPDRVAPHQGQRLQGFGAKHQNVQGIVIVTVGAGNKAVVCGIVGRGIQHPIQHDQTGLLIQFILFLASLRDLNNGDKSRRCRCSPVQIQRYRSRLSGPLLDRIDIHVEAPALSIDELRRSAPGETSAVMRERIAAAREIQKKRFAGTPLRNNAQMTSRHLREFCALTAEQGMILQKSMESLGLSARAYDRILKVARTIADLAGTPQIETPQLLEAINYRSLDRNTQYF